MKLYDFSLESRHETAIDFSVAISYAFYNALCRIEDYNYHFENFHEELKMLHENKAMTAKFLSIERQLEIYFKQLEFGHIAVTIKLNHIELDYHMYQSMLIINYEIDQSFLPELIREIDDVIQENNTL